MSLCDQYFQLQISELETKITIMETLSTKSGFVKTVMLEFMQNENLQLAFHRVHCMFRSLFPFDAYQSFDQFLKELS